MRYRLLVGLLCLMAIVSIGWWFLKQSGSSPKGLFTGELILSNVQITNIQVLQLESFPVQINLVLSGKYGDPCSQLRQIDQRREGTIFYLEVSAYKPVDARCVQSEKKFEQVVELDVTQLPSGEYTVKVGGLEERFTLASDNQPPTTQTPQLLNL